MRWIKFRVAQALEAHRHARKRLETLAHARGAATALQTERVARARQLAAGHSESAISARAAIGNGGDRHCAERSRPLRPSRPSMTLMSSGDERADGRRDTKNARMRAAAPKRARRRRRNNRAFRAPPSNAEKKRFGASAFGCRQKSSLTRRNGARAQLCAIALDRQKTCDRNQRSLKSRSCESTSVKKREFVWYEEILRGDS